MGFWGRLFRNRIVRSGYSIRIEYRDGTRDLYNRPGFPFPHYVVWGLKRGAKNHADALRLREHIRDAYPVKVYIEEA